MILGIGSREVTRGIFRAVWKFLRRKFVRLLIENLEGDAVFEEGEKSYLNRVS